MFSFLHGFPLVSSGFFQLCKKPAGGLFIALGLNVCECACTYGALR